MSNSIALKDLAKLIDHSLLQQNVTDRDILKGIEISKRYNVAAICTKPYTVRMVAEYLEGTGIGVCTVIAFPHGNITTTMRVVEAEMAMADGATEIDMVVNIGKVLSKDWKYVSEELKVVNDVVTAKGNILKVIFENDFLEDYHIIKLCEICSEHRVAFVKTSTGYGFVKQENGMYSYKGATIHQVKLMRSHSADYVKIKAAGAIRSLDDFLKFRELGVSRIGATATESILEEAKKRGIQ